MTLLEKINSLTWYDLINKLKDILKGLNDKPSGSEPKYKVYTALLTQTGTDAPVATVLENTLGGEVVWSRTNPGDYVATLAGAFTQNKTFLNNPLINNIEGRLNQLALQILDINSIRISGGNDLIALEPITDNCLSGDQIEIRVYS